MKKIAVIGTGYVGLVTGTCFAETGNQVICVDIDKEKVEKMKKGLVPIYEPNLDTFFERNITAGRLKFTTSLEKGIKDAEIIFLALPTPPGEDGSADLSYILGVAEQLGKLIKDFKVIVDKSTVPVGTAEKVDAAIKKNGLVDFAVVSNPEFLREGFAVSDFMKPDRVVLGTSNNKARGIMEKLYKPFLRQGNPIYFMDEKSAELTKYAANSFLATKITFMNEIANFCEIVGADVDKVRAGIGSDSRIGKRFLFPGIGYGGSCFPKDVQALVKSGNDVNFSFEILNSVINVNQNQKTILYPKIKNYFKGNLTGKNIAVWGLSFKPDTDDIREAPSIYLMKKLIESGAIITAYDPEAMNNVKAVLGDSIKYADNEYSALNNCDALLICTEWSTFRNPDFNLMKKNMKDLVIFDGRNLFDLEEMNNKGFYYSSIGRKLINK
ncbi:MAG: UDP-glucose/GDP-mannose dehydrogenase family protein [Crocinitomicaceae bacterium]|nr:UDP-glucose/GDP-mannose dehydrogenase family protein [Crocinitomicaceae bacterium]